jgi:hypothetical protein
MDFYSFIICGIYNYMYYMIMCMIVYMIEYFKI